MFVLQLRDNLPPTLAAFVLVALCVASLQLVSVAVVLVVEFLVGCCTEQTLPIVNNGLVDFFMIR